MECGNFAKNTLRKGEIMRKKVCTLLFLAFFMYGCTEESNGEPVADEIPGESTASHEIISKDYKDTVLLFGTYQVEFYFHLENIGNSDSVSKIIESLIYHGNGFDEYIENRKADFIGEPEESWYPHYYDEDGKEYISSFNRASLIEEFSIKHFSDLYVIIENYTWEYGGGAHGNYWTKYYIVDLTEERILDLDDILTEMPNDLLKERIELSYGITWNSVYTGEDLWPPNSITFSGGSIELLWNPYSKVPPGYSATIILYFSWADVQEYLTEKGRTLANGMR